MHSTTTVVLTSPIPPNISYTKAIATLHDHPTMIMLQPLVQSYEVLPEDYTSTVESPIRNYRITEKLSYLPFHLWDAPLSFLASFQDRPAGVFTRVQAPMGVQLKVEWEVVRAEDVEAGAEGWILKETVVVTSNAVFMPFVKMTMRKAHEEMQVRFLKRCSEG